MDAIERKQVTLGESEGAVQPFISTKKMGAVLTHKQIGDYVKCPLTFVHVGFWQICDFQVGIVHNNTDPGYPFPLPAPRIYSVAILHTGHTAP